MYYNILYNEKLLYLNIKCKEKSIAIMLYSLNSNNFYIVILLDIRTFGQVFCFKL